ncbi:hypothetical protein NPIL_586251 [Nephila pilipes]|uniref:Uncharacterized protein n=1 Tax=Nephila pilipes TaxID=299642 RepID=A0A8X6M6A6_NEPPI|nr:hypothetical protein NPIL_586251 [Nephila pilipes]
MYTCNEYLSKEAVHNHGNGRSLVISIKAGLPEEILWNGKVSLSRLPLPSPNEGTWEEANDNKQWGFKLKGKKSSPRHTGASIVWGGRDPSQQTPRAIGEKSRISEDVPVEREKGDRKPKHVKWCRRDLTRRSREFPFVFLNYRNGTVK